MTEQRINRQGDTVDYFGPEGKVDAVVLSFGKLSDAQLQLADGTILPSVAKGERKGRGQEYWLPKED